MHHLRLPFPDSHLTGMLLQANICPFPARQREICQSMNDGADARRRQGVPRFSTTRRRRPAKGGVPPYRLDPVAEQRIDVQCGCAERVRCRREIGLAQSGWTTPRSRRATCRRGISVRVLTDCTSSTRLPAGLCCCRVHLPPQTDHIPVTALSLLRTHCQDVADPREIGAVADSLLL